MGRILWQVTAAAAAECEAAQLALITPRGEAALATRELSLGLAMQFEVGLNTFHVQAL